MKKKLSHLSLALLCLLPAVGFTACQREAQEEEKTAEEAPPGTPQQERTQEENR